MKIELAKTEIYSLCWYWWNWNEWSLFNNEGKGFKVQGSDLSQNKNIERLKKENIKIFIGQKKQNLKMLQ